MKHFYSFMILVICTLLVQTKVDAQYPYLHSRYLMGSGTNTNTIVRAYGARQAVVYYERAGLGYVALVDVQTGQKREIALDTRVKIKDMSITSDTLYMGGGEYDALGVPYVIGTVVYLDIREFFSPTMTVNYFQPSYFYLNEIQQIASCTYVDYLSGQRKTKLYTVGDLYYHCDPNQNEWLYNNFNNRPPSHHDYCGSDIPEIGGYKVFNNVMEIANPFVTDTHYSYGYPYSTLETPRILMPITYNDGNEVINDVVVSGGYASFVGVAQGGVDSLTVHVCTIEKSFLFDTDGVDSYSQSRFSKYYAYPLGGQGSRVYKACSMGGGVMAVATTNETSSLTGIAVRVIDLATGQMLNSRRVYAQGAELHDMVYDNGTQKLVLLFKTVGDVGAFWFCPIDPYSTVANEFVSTMRDANNTLMYHSIDIMGVGTFVSTGDNRGLVSRYPYWNPSVPCYGLYNFRVDKIDYLQSILSNFDYDICNLHLDNRQVVVTPVASSIYSDCMIH